MDGTAFRARFAGEKQRVKQAVVIRGGGHLVDGGAEREGGGVPSMGPCPFFPSQLGRALNTPSLNTLQGGASLLLSPDLVSAEHETQSDFPPWSSPRCWGCTLCLKCSPGFHFLICSFSSPFSPFLLADYLLPLKKADSAGKSH